MSSPGRWVRVFALAALICGAVQTFAQRPELRSTASFAVLGGSVSNSGKTVLTGNVAAKPSGSEVVVKLGEVRNDLAPQALRDQTLLYEDLARRPCGDPHVYCVSSPLSGVFSIDADVYWIIRTIGPLTTAPNTAVRILNGGGDNNVFWQVPGSATLGAGTTFFGNIVAAGNITLNEGANVSGRLLTHGSVVLNSNTVSMCCPRITIPPPVDPHIVLGETYRYPLSPSGGVEPYQFSPSNLIESPNVLRVTPVSTGTFPITVIATDANGCPGVLSFELRVDPVPQCQIVVAPASTPPTPPVPYLLPNAKAGEPYAVTFAGSCTTTPVCSITGNRPAGLELHDCVLSGTPDACGIYDFTITVSGTPGAPGSQAYRLVVGGPTITFTPEILPSAKVGVIYCETVKTNIGMLQIVGTLPDGLTPSDNLAICGVPRKKGSYPFIVTATVPGCTPVAKQYQIDVDCPIITIQPPTLPPAILDQPYSATITAKTTPPSLIPPTFRVDGLPDGLTTCDDLPPGSNGIRICGAPLKLGKSLLTVTATLDETSLCSATQPTSIDVVCPTITITPTTLPPGVVGSAYLAQLVATGSQRPPYTFVELDTPPNAPPPGLTLASDGTVSGTPTAAGDYVFCVRVTDSVGCYVDVCVPIHIDPVGPPPPPGGGPIPTLSEWGMGALCALLAAVGRVAVRRSAS